MGECLRTGGSVGCSTLQELFKKKMNVIWKIIANLEKIYMTEKLCILYNNHTYVSN